MAEAFDTRQLEELYQQLGQARADDVICGVLEELATLLSMVERCYREGRRQDMRRHVNTLSQLAAQIGLPLVARVARDVINCIDTGHTVPLAATLSRLVRAGEHSLVEIWDLKDMPI
ncbi:hypothetical protein ROA7450_01437 [Roseovarius albus]|uniref:Hpt domain protein n=1 Tax=Roseovarius albus TaxID=1247867 RepID=A0A1X6YVE5_9RHOB|nr:hypothetical protein ROA7450_01437 [Roseovarius albus]